MVTYEISFPFYSSWSGKMSSPSDGKKKKKGHQNVKVVGERNIFKNYFHQILKQSSNFLQESYLMHLFITIAQPAGYSGENF